MNAFFVSSDPGGTQEIAAVVRWLKRNQPHVKCRLFTDTTGHRSPDLIYCNVPAGSPPVIAIFDQDKPRFVFTGTSLKSPIELLFIEEAHRRGIPCYSVIDHWTSFRERFLGNSGRLMLPTQVFVNDREALVRASQEGLPRNRLTVFGNPYFDEAASYKPQKSRGEVLQSVGVKVDRKLILFLTDALREVTGSETATVSQFGYSEISILTEFMACLKRLSLEGNFAAESYDFVIKLHPMEDAEKYSEVEHMSQTDFPWRIKFVKHVPLWDLLFYADYVVGMFTAAILQASCMGKRPLRIELDVKGKDCLPIPESAYYARVIEARQLDATVRNWLQADLNSSGNCFLKKEYEEILQEIVT